MKILVDMNLSPRWAPMLRAAGFDAEHWSHLGRHDAPDAEIFEFASGGGWTVLTYDLDFGSLLAARRGAGPSVVQLRVEDARPEICGDVVTAAIRRTEAELRGGALGYIGASERANSDIAVDRFRTMNCGRRIDPSPEAGMKETSSARPRPDEKIDDKSRLLAALRAAGTPERAAQEKRYQKSSWEHWGVPVPAMDAAMRATTRDLEAEALHELAAMLWREPVWDLKIVAGRLLTRKSVPADAKLWRFVTERMADLDGWAVADNLANVAHRCLDADLRRLGVVERWVESPHLWTRRATLVFTLPWAKEERSPERMLGWAARLRTDPQWFIQKAIGWWLRELGKRDPERVKLFLKAHGGAMKAFARREAEKYL